MNWIEIDDVTPNRPRQVLLGCMQIPQYGIGMLGGAENNPTFQVEGEGGHRSTITATHWCELTAPELE